MRRHPIVASILILISVVCSSPLQSAKHIEYYSSSTWPSLNNNFGQSAKRTLVASEHTSSTEFSVELDKRQTYDCTDLEAAFDSRCWDELNLAAYLLDPETGWNHTVRICGTAESAENNDGSDCCKVGEPWTTCYLRLGHGSPGKDCSQINSQFCSYESTLSDRLDPAVKPEVQYIMKNIYSVNNFFTTYYEALGSAQSDAQTIVQALINALDPVKPTSFSVFLLFTVLSAGLAFLGAPSIAVSFLSFSILARTAAQVFTISLQQAPSTAKALWPTGTQSSQSVQIANVEAELGNGTNQLAAMINNAVQLLMSDVPTFVKFCESGMWSGSMSLSLPSKVEGLDYALRTYMTSEVMRQNGWQATPLIGPFETVAEVEQYGCQMGNDGICTNSEGSAYYWSHSTGNVYVFGHYTNQYTDLNPYQVLKDTMDNNWAIIDVLFDGAFNCTKQGSLNESVVNFNWDGTLNIACISQLPIKIACGVKCPMPLKDGSCPLINDNNPCWDRDES